MRKNVIEDLFQCQTFVNNSGRDPSYYAGYEFRDVHIDTTEEFTHSGTHTNIDREACSQTRNSDKVSKCCRVLPTNPEWENMFDKPYTHLGWNPTYHLFLLFSFFRWGYGVIESILIYAPNPSDLI